MNTTSILSWDTDSDTIIDKISATKSFLKIGLKTYNDSHFIARWIRHHREIVGLENLIVADNMSDDAQVLGVYEKYGERLNVFQFSGFHNAIQHDRPRWDSLWKAISDSCEYFLFIDTDEFLVWIDQNGWYSGNTLMDRLKVSLKKDKPRAIPTFLLENATQTDKIFPVSYGKLFASLQWGKPICASPLDRTHGYIHNCQMNESEWNSSVPSNLFLLHLTKLYPEQRLRANWNKLVSRGFVESTDSWDTFDFDKAKFHKDSVIVRCAAEIKKILSETPATPAAYQGVPQGSIKLIYDGTVKFSSEQERNIMAAFLGEDNPGFIFGLLLMELADLIGKGERERAREVIASRTEWLARDELDGYGHPLWKKELMRALINLQEWDLASGLMPGEDTRNPGWHEILFARGYAKSGDIAKAKIWWSLVLKRHPKHREALEFLCLSAVATPDPSPPGAASAKSSSAQDQAPKIKIGDPTLEPEGLALLGERLKLADTFLEYGAGGSTVLSAKLGVKNIHSVDSDRNYLAAVEAAVSQHGSSILKTYFADIGPTKQWGWPVDNRACAKYPGYPAVPWKTLRELGQSPDLILIDGRFRVACFLACLLLAKPGTKVLFDDYVERPYYHIAEKYLPRITTAGRMVEFIVEDYGSREGILLDLMHYCTDPA